MSIKLQKESFSAFFLIICLVFHFFDVILQTKSTKDSNSHKYNHKKKKKRL